MRRSASHLFLFLVLASSLAWAQGSPQQGFELMVSMTAGNCLACHTVPGQTGSNSINSTFGPSLEKVAQRYNEQALRQWVSDARQIKPGTLMPPFGSTVGTHRASRTQAILSPEEIDHVVAALQTLR